MKIETQYNYESSYRVTQESDLLKMIAEEVGDADPKGVLTYIKEAIQNGKPVLVGSCRFRKAKETK